MFQGGVSVWKYASNIEEEEKQLQVKIMMYLKSRYDIPGLGWVVC